MNKFQDWGTAFNRKQHDTALTLDLRKSSEEELFLNLFYPPVSEASREVANLTVRKNPHTSVYGVKECVCLSVANFDPNYLGTGRTELTEIFFRTSIFHLTRTKNYLKKSLQLWLPELFL